MSEENKEVAQVNNNNNNNNNNSSLGHQGPSESIPPPLENVATEETPIAAPKLQQILKLATPGTLSKLMDLVGDEFAIKNIVRWLTTDPDNQGIAADQLEAVATDYVVGAPRAFKETVFNVFRYLSESRVNALLSATSKALRQAAASQSTVKQEPGNSEVQELAQKTKQEMQEVERYDKYRSRTLEEFAAINEHTIISQHDDKMKTVFAGLDERKLKAEKYRKMIYLAIVSKGQDAPGGTVSSFLSLLKQDNNYDETRSFEEWSREFKKRWIATKSATFKSFCAIVQKPNEPLHQLSERIRSQFHHLPEHSRCLDEGVLCVNVLLAALRPTVHARIDEKWRAQAQEGKILPKTLQAFDLWAIHNFDSDVHKDASYASAATAAQVNQAPASQPAGNKSNPYYHPPAGDNSSQNRGGDKPNDGGWKQKQTSKKSSKNKPKKEKLVPPFKSPDYQATFKSADGKLLQWKHVASGRSIWGSFDGTIRAAYEN